MSEQRGQVGTRREKEEVVSVVEGRKRTEIWGGAEEISQARSRAYGGELGLAKQVGWEQDIDRGRVGVKETGIGSSGRKGCAWGNRRGVTKCYSPKKNGIDIESLWSGDRDQLEGAWRGMGLLRNPVMGLRGLGQGAE